MEFTLFSVILILSIVGFYVYLNIYFDKLTYFSNNLILEEKTNKIDISFLKYKLFDYSKFTSFFYDNGYIYCKNGTYVIFISRGKSIYISNTYILCNNSNSSKYPFYEGVTSW